ncbi:CPBP family intramembrane metalloprotease domain-containing protein [Pleurocapsa sp. CCALA 161]|uniref:CPBP family intramembrane glutamic endopeptidase n=1 Tax=Pleurocapsa sp. CCALA 161 TaxID=2107688 RepID=UPI000D071C72|nr:type II CAAX endopeptidase family protein [Pleurocapsa sp. CCALA 161]PSB08812.1 CPBP family intramembrane metalloprotease domain-containing protein [Pleurocapsa sp. CCALA 161]
MTIKRAILALLTILAIVQIGSSLKNSFSQPQIQSRLELYQTNLVLQVAEFKSSPTDDFELNSAVSSLVGQDPYTAASSKYQQIRQESLSNRDNFQSQLQQLSQAESGGIEVTNAPAKNSLLKTQLQQEIVELNQFLNELDLKQGILLGVQHKSAEAIALWSQVIDRLDAKSPYAQTASVLKQLWQNQAQVDVGAVAIINRNLDGWFRYQALAKYNEVNHLKADLALLQEQQSKVATNSIFKLALISGIPVLGGIAGVILLVSLIIQRFVKPEQAIMATNSQIDWKTPWNWEITWQVLIVGFFFVGQFVLPILISLAGINPSNSSLRIKALYVLGTYILMSVGGISVLYLSIKSYFPLPEDWFRFKFNTNWFIWGFGGYLVAIPLVLLVSAINQQLWHGQGGSNPLLFLALQAQDQVALVIFFSTASIAAPVFEEIMFRGFLLPSLTRYTSLTGAIVISGFIFAIAHLSLSEVLPLATLGMVLGFVYTRSRNLLAPMLLHCLWNSGTLISLFVLGSGV